MSGGAYDGPVYNQPAYQFTATAAFVKERALADQGCGLYGAGLAPLVKLPGWNQTFWGANPAAYFGNGYGSYGGYGGYGAQAPWGAYGGYSGSCGAAPWAGSLQSFAATGGFYGY